MNPLPQPDSESERRGSSRLLNVVIRAGLIGALTGLGHRLYSSFLTLMVATWSVLTGGAI